MPAREPKTPAKVPIEKEAGRVFHKEEEVEEVTWDVVLEEARVVNIILCCCRIIGNCCFREDRATSVAAVEEYLVLDRLGFVGTR